VITPALNPVRPAPLPYRLVAQIEAAETQLVAQITGEQTDVVAQTVGPQTTQAQTLPATLNAVTAVALEVTQLYTAFALLAKFERSVVSVIGYSFLLLFILFKLLICIPFLPFQNYRKFHELNR
jgi:hypothetical protein